MLDKLLRLWRSAARPYDAVKSIDCFDLRRFSPSHGISVHASRTLRLTGSVPAWSYLVTWNNTCPVHRANEGGLQLDMEIEVRTGELEAALLAADGKTLLCRTDVAHGGSRIVLETRRAIDAASLILRSRSQSTVDVEILALTSRITSVGVVRERGFLSKDAFDDLAGRMASPEVTIVDVGANRGDTVAAFLDRFPAARIWALEPHPATFAGMAARFAGDARVLPRKLALSERRGQSVMHVYSNAAINSLSSVAVGAERLIDGPVVAEPTIVVDHLSLGEFCNTEGLEQFDILKLDTQGHDLAILQGQADLLRSGRIRYILAELLFAPLYTGQAQAGQVISLLESCGYQVLDFYDFVYDESQGLKWGDALFAHVEACQATMQQSGAPA
jgi:FkbM family methyltransferase